MLFVIRYSGLQLCVWRRAFAAVVISAVFVACGTALLLSSASASAVSLERLWLPTTYRGHYLKLIKAAEVVEALDACEEVLRATIDLDVTTADKAFYRVLCRASGGGSYSELVDGVSFEPQSLAVKAQPPETEAERELRLAREAEAAEQQRLAAIAQAAQEAEESRQAQEQAELDAQRLADKQAQQQRVRTQTLTEVCQSEILAKTSEMINLTWVTDTPAVEELENGQVRVYTAFDAENVWGHPLNYEAVCTISTPKELVVIVSERA